MNLYLSPSTCISYQNTISGDLELTPLAEMEQIQLQEPAYKELLKPALLRRMSTVLKMANYAAKATLTKADGEVENPDAIVVGTGLGCIRDTIGFLDEVVKNEEQTLAPTAFIQSTHNSIAGQIALMLKNYRYNMTLVQQSISFEMALIDAQLQLETDAAQHVLVGAADECTDNLVDLLNNLAKATQSTLPQLGEGAAFFNAYKEANKDCIASVEKIATATKAESLDAFLAKNKINVSEHDLVLNGGCDLKADIPQFHFKNYCGEYFTAPAFACHLALEAYKGNVVLVEQSKPNSILILNTFAGQIGAISLKRFELQAT